MDLNRRSFFTGCLRSAANLLQPALASMEARPPEHTVPDIRSDLPEALMAEEARRLGLDPDTDQEQVYKTLATRMARAVHERSRTGEKT